METVLEALLGPLAAVECRRELGRPWVFVVRTLATVPPALVICDVKLPTFCSLPVSVPSRAVVAELVPMPSTCTASPAPVVSAVPSAIAV